MEKTLKKLREGLDLKIPIEGEDYETNSKKAIKEIEHIIFDRIKEGTNIINIRLGLRQGLPMENIHRIAAPIVEQWAIEVFEDALELKEHDLVGLEVTPGRTSLIDVILSFKSKENQGFVSGVDVKGTSMDIPNSGKSPNITSFAKIRTEYIRDNDFMFIILSLKHQVFTDNTGEEAVQSLIIKKANAYDLKYLKINEFNINPALGTGQIQINDIHYVDANSIRTVNEFIDILDYKYISIEQNTKSKWEELAFRNGWTK